MQISLNKRFIISMTLVGVIILILVYSSANSYSRQSGDNELLARVIRDELPCPAGKTTFLLEYSP